MVMEPLVLNAVKDMEDQLRMKLDEARLRYNSNRNQETVAQYAHALDEFTRFVSQTIFWIDV